MKSSKKQALTIIVDDNGYAAHKIARLDKGRIVCEKFPTSIQSGSTGLTDVEGHGNDLYHVMGKSGVRQSFTCSSSVTEPLDLRNDQYPFSDANRVLAHHAMHMTGHSGASVVLGVTLPFRDFYNSDGKKNVDLHERTIANFMEPNVTKEGVDSCVNIAKAVVYPEAFCAMYDWGLDDGGDPKACMDELAVQEGSMLIIDIGGSTTDIVAIKLPNGEVRLDHAHSGTRKVGVLNVKERLLKAYQSRIGGSAHENLLSNNKMERLLATGSTRIGGAQADFQNERATALREVTDDILNYMRTTAGGLQQYDVILFVGGGAIQFQADIKRELPGAIISDEFANARGALKYMIASDVVSSINQE